MLSSDDPTVEIPLDGTLDLHTFRPSEVAEVIPEYLAACSERGVRHLRIIHGKGRGTLRAIVEAVLRRNPMVAAFKTADESAGGWGATLVDLRDHPSGSLTV